MGNAALNLLANLLTKLLNTLPFNGDKTKLALWVALLAFIQVQTGIDLGFGIPADAVLPVSIASAVAFLLHKLLKKKVGLDKWGEAIR